MAESHLPTNHVVGIIHGAHGTHEAARDLSDSGYPELEVLSGEEKTEIKDATREPPDPIRKLIQRFADHLSEEPAYLDQYREEADRGGTIVAVPVEGHEQAERVKAILERHGGVNIRHFGRLAVSDLTPETNPSAPSDERP
jgi:hypothetical protein